MVFAKHFKIQEFFVNQMDYFNQMVKDGVPPEWVIDRPLVDALDLIREHFGSPVIINSGWRSSDKNIDVGGKKYSFHLLGKAADIVVKNADPREVVAFAKTIPQIKGIGLASTWVHVDSRNAKDVVVWRYS